MDSTPDYGSVSEGSSPSGDTKHMPVYHSILVTVAALYRWV